jgi:hypothetical protein
MRFFIRILITGCAAIVLGVMVIALKDMFSSSLWPFDGIIAIVIGIGLIGWSIKEMKKKDN